MKKGQKRSILVVFSIFILVSLFIAGCSNDSSNKDDGNDKDTAKTDGYPERNIEIVVGYGEGGGTDSFVRAVAKPMSEDLGVNVKVVNKPGSSGLIAEDYVWNQPADGYTIWAITPDFLVNIAKGDSSQEVDDYTPIGRGQFDTYAIQTIAGSEYEDIDKLVEAAKENPGEITIGGTASDGFDELSVKRIEKQMGVEFKYVPYDEVGKMHSDVLGGHIDLMLEEIGPTVSQLEADNLELVVLFAEDKVKGYEDVPLGIDKGWDFNDGNQRSMVVKSDTPQEIIDILEEAFAAAMEDEEYVEYTKKSYLDLREGYLNSEDLQKDFEENLVEYKEFLN